MSDETPKEESFTFRDMYEELITIGRERREFIEGKAKMGEIERKMAEWRLRRLRAAAEVMRVLANGKTVEELKAEGWHL